MPCHRYPALCTHSVPKSSKTFACFPLLDDSAATRPAVCHSKEGGTLGSLRRPTLSCKFQKTHTLIPVLAGTWDYLSIASLPASTSYQLSCRRRQRAHFQVLRNPTEANQARSSGTGYGRLLATGPCARRSAFDTLGKLSRPDAGCKHFSGDSF